MRKLLAALTLTVMLGAQEWALIARPGSAIGELNTEQIREIYLGNTRFVNGVRLIPLQLGADDPLRLQFERQIVGLSRPALREWWMRRHYLGRRPPKVMGSTEAVVAYVQRVPGAVGYVPYAQAEDANVSVLYYHEGEEH